MMKFRQVVSIAATTISLFVGLIPEQKVNAIVLNYQTGFEQPTFIPGSLNSQDGWINRPTDTAFISNQNPQSGEQSIEVTGGGLGKVGSLLGTRFGRPFFIDTLVNQTPLIDINVDVLLVGPSTDTGEGPADDLISANLNALSVKDGGPASLGNLLLSSSGEVWVLGSRPEDQYFLGIPIDLGEYYRLGLRLDFAARMTQFFVDEVLVATLPFDPSITSNEFAFGLLEVFAVDNPDVIDPNDYLAYFDNYSVKAVPEPLAILGTLTALGFGALLKKKKLSSEVR